MPAPENIRLFETYAAAVLERLYARFPEKVSLDALTLSGETSIDEFGTAPPRARVARETIDWLACEGYLTAQMVPMGALNARLTEKGLAALRRVPDPVRDQTSLGERLRRFASAGAHEAMAETVRIILSHAT